ncbi:MAG: helix-turn-helix transcriptional regulator [Dehalococcoidia bacterium]|nr:helix-turn-helix transcriptional regulator [Dehalococcoidia bacterium]
MTGIDPMTRGGVSMRERLRTDYAWTPRQRQVLDLLRAGRSNAEIAGALGVSLQGAKWHVTEILSKLQADSREEAADYWRRYHGLAPRFGRVFRGGLALGLAKWAAVAGGLAVAGVAAVVVVLVLSQLGDEGAPAGSPDATPTPSPSASASPSPSASATATTPTPVASGAPIPGLATPPAVLALAAPQLLPAGWTLFGWQAQCYQCGASYADFRRYTSDGRTLTSDFLFSFTQPPGSGPDTGSGVYTVAFGSCGRRVAAGLCTRGYCGGEGEPSADATAELFVSGDGGRTWRSLGPLARNSFVVGFLGDEVVIQQFVSQTPTGWKAAFVTTGGQSLAPADFPANWVVLEEGRDPVWVRYGPDSHLRSTYRDRGGTVSPPLAETDAFLLGLAGADGYVWELHTRDAGGQPTTVLATADRSGAVRRALRWDGHWWSLRGLTGGRYVAGYGDDPSLGPAPAPFVVDLQTGVLTPLTGLPRSQAETYTYPLALTPVP